MIIIIVVICVYIYIHIITYICVCIKTYAPGPVQKDLPFLLSGQELMEELQEHAPLPRMLVAGEVEHFSPCLQDVFGPPKKR
jgi:hypothetical protein